MSDQHPQPAFDVRIASIGEELVVVRDTDAYQFGDVEKRVWQLMDGQRSVDEIAAAICAEFDVDTPTARSDVAAFVGQLREASLVE